MWKLQTQNGGLTLSELVYTLNAREIEANVSKIQTVVVNRVLRCQIFLQDGSIQTSRCWEYDGWQLNTWALGQRAPPPLGSVPLLREGWGRWGKEAWMRKIQRSSSFASGQNNSKAPCSTKIDWSLCCECISAPHPPLFKLLPSPLRILSPRELSNKHCANLSSESVSQGAELTII